MKVLKYDEFVNEGIISDFKAKEAESMKEISSSDKKFIIDLMQALNDIDMSSALYCDNTKKKVQIWSLKRSSELNGDYEEVSIEDAVSGGVANLPITGKSKMFISDKHDSGVRKEVFDWFSKMYTKKLKGDPEFEGKMGVNFILSIKEEIKKEIL